MRPMVLARDKLGKTFAFFTPVVLQLLALVGMTYHCGIRVPAVYSRLMEQLFDPELDQDYRVYVVHRADKRLRPIWNMGTRIERKVFWETDGNSRLALFLAAWRWLTNTVMVVIVDQRPGEDGMPRNFAFGMMRLSWGSAKSLITIKALAGKPWFIKNVRQLLEDNGIPRDADLYGDAMDISMIAMLKEYRNGRIRGKHYKGKYYDKRPVVMGMLAQTCQFAEAHKFEWWFTILNKLTWKSIVLATTVQWTEFEGVSDEWLPYFGSKESKPFFCNFPIWIRFMHANNPELFEIIMRDGLKKFIALEPRHPKREYYTLAA